MNAPTALAQSPPALDAALLQTHPALAAVALESVDVAAAMPLLASCEAHVLAPVLAQLTPTQARLFLTKLGPSHVADVISKLSIPRAALLLRGMTEEDRKHLLTFVEPALQHHLSVLLNSAPHSAAALMDPRVLRLQPSMKVRDALDQLRVHQFHKRPTQARRVLVLLDDNHRLEGMVAIQDLAFADPDERLQDYRQSVPATVQPTTTHEEIVKILQMHHVSSLPVVDAQERLVGIVRQDELDAIAREGAIGDMQAMFGVSREEQALSPPWFSVRQRLPWLQINLFTAFAAAAVVGLFEDTIARYTALAVLLPVVAGQAGNTGAQALAVVIRGLALHEITLTHWPRVVSKEVVVALLNGIGVSITTSLCIYVWSRSLGLTLIIALAMIVSMLIAGVAGAFVPLLLTRLGQDPAQSSSIILTTITDIAGFFSFLGIATALITML
ncbi:MAG: magnesium transporter [Pseudomonadota bacterium]